MPLGHASYLRSDRRAEQKQDRAVSHVHDRRAQGVCGGRRCESIVQLAAATVYSQPPTTPAA